MVTQTLALVLSAVCILGIIYLAWLQTRQFDNEREEWREARSKLLDRIQSGGLAEVKAQGRADTPLKCKEKSPLVKQFEKERWL